MRQKIVIKRKSLEKILRENIPKFDDIVEAIIYSRDQFGVVLKNDAKIDPTIIDTIKQKLSRQYNLVVEDVEDEIERRRRLENKT